MSLLSAFHTMTVERRLPYRVDRTVNLVARALGSRERTIHRCGLTFRVRRLTCDEAFVENVVVRREYLPDEIRIGPADTVIDIGGNIGTFALFAATMADRVIAVEPEPDNLRLLWKNRLLNPRLAGKITVVDAAVTSADTTVTLYTSHEGGYHTTNPNRLTDSTPVQVRGVSLHRILTESRYASGQCDLLKLDCEGAEFGALYTLPADDFPRIRQIAMEYHASRERTAEEAREMIGFLAARGFTIIRHEPYSDYPGGHLFAVRV